MRELATLFDEALEEHVEAVRSQLAKGLRPAPRSETQFSIRENGMPSLSEASPFTRNGSPDYAALLEPPYHDDEARRRGRYPPDRFPALQALTGYMLEDPDRAPGFANPLPPDFIRIDAQFRIEGAAAAYLNRFGDEPSTRLRRSVVLRPFLRQIFAPRLDLAFIAPIAMTRFEPSRLRLGPQAFLMKMSPALQKARWSAKAYGGGAHEAVVGAATHAFVLTGWSVENDNPLRLAQSLSRSNPKPREIVDMLFAALRLQTDVSTGYAQEVWLARGWRTQHPDRPEVTTVGVRRYPEWMDDFGWMVEETPLVTRAQLARVATTYRAIVSATDSRLVLALRRLNAAMTRDDPADAILDATIALEILLGDDDSQAVSWKLRMRAAALAGLSGDHAAMLATRHAMTSIYAMRSSIVHGTRGRKKAKTGDNPLHASESARLAIDTLRLVLRTLVENQRYLQPGVIDQELMLTPRGVRP